MIGDEISRVLILDSGICVRDQKGCSYAADAASQWEEMRKNRRISERFQGGTILNVYAAVIQISLNQTFIADNVYAFSRVVSVYFQKYLLILNYSL